MGQNAGKLLCGCSGRDKRWKRNKKLRSNEIYQPSDEINYKETSPKKSELLPEKIEVQFTSSAYDDNVSTELIKKLSKSVGIIMGHLTSGTGFRVGEKYVMTALHLVKGICSFGGIFKESNLESPDVYICFDYCGGYSTDALVFHFLGQIRYANEDLDVAVLELKESENKMLPPKIPCSVNCQGGIEQGVHLVGQSYRDPNKIVAKNVQLLQKDNNLIKQAQTWSTEMFYENGYVGLEDANLELCYCYYQPGMEGSPGFVCLQTGKTLSLGDCENKVEVESANRNETVQEIRDYYVAPTELVLSTNEINDFNSDDDPDSDNEITYVKMVAQNDDLTLQHPRLQSRTLHSSFSFNSESNLDQYQSNSIALSEKAILTSGYLNDYNDSEELCNFDIDKSLQTNEDMTIAGTREISQTATVSCSNVEKTDRVISFRFGHDSSEWDSSSCFENSSHGTCDETFSETNSSELVTSHDNIYNESYNTNTKGDSPPHYFSAVDELCINSVSAKQEISLEISSTLSFTESCLKRARRKELNIHNEQTVIKNDISPNMSFIDDNKLDNNPDNLVIQQNHQNKTDNDTTLEKRITQEKISMSQTNVKQNQVSCGHCENNKSSHVDCENNQTSDGKIRDSHQASDDEIEEHQASDEEIKNSQASDDKIEDSQASDDKIEDNQASDYKLEDNQASNDKIEGNQVSDTDDTCVIEKRLSNTEMKQEERPDCIILTVIHTGSSEALHISENDSELNSYCAAGNENVDKCFSTTIVELENNDKPEHSSSKPEDKTLSGSDSSIYITDNSLPAQIYMDTDYDERFNYENGKPPSIKSTDAMSHSMDCDQYNKKIDFLEKPPTLKSTDACSERSLCESEEITVYEPAVVFMLLRGYPTFYYRDGTTKEVKELVTESRLVNGGVTMKSIFDHMKQYHIYRELCTDIFMSNNLNFELENRRVIYQ